MIARLAGVVLERAPDHVVVDVAGVGFRVFVSSSTMGQVPATGESVALQIHTLVRDDAIQLYGFASAAERELFRTLLKLSGIGPKNAMVILSGMELRALVGAIATGDVERLVRLPGVGRKTAERIVMELRDRVGGFESELSVAPPRGEAAGSHLAETIDALSRLGLPRPRAERAARDAAQRVAPGAGLETWIREALREVGGG